MRRRPARGWVGANGAGVGLHEPYDQLRAGGPPGIHALGHSQSPEARLTFGYATPHVATIRLISAQQIRLHPVGLDGFFLIGSSPQEPTTRAVAIGPDGEEILAAPPLAGQRTLLQVALADPDADAQALRSTCEEALQLSGQQARLIDALLMLATSERGVESWEPFDLAQLTQDIVQSRRPDAERHSVQVDATLQSAIATGDPGLVASLVANLLDNAIRHNVADGTVEISTSATADGARLPVSNTGALVPLVELEGLFEPFQRLGDQRVARADGHGLGLAIVKAIAAAHSANLTARPGPNGGLDVHVTFRPSV